MATARTRTPALPGRTNSHPSARGTAHRGISALGALALAAAALLTAAVPASAATASDTCAGGGVITIAVRGTTTGSETSLGELQTLADQIQKTTAYKDRIENFNYHSTNTGLFGAGYLGDVADGKKKLQARLKALHDSCPASTKFVLVGYSKGANVVGDALDNGEAQLPAAVNKQIKAVILYGNPRFNATESYDRGTYNDQTLSVLGRPKGQLSAYATRIRDYCLAKDAVCQDNLTDEGWKVHEQYFAKYNDSATAFVIDKLGK